MMNNNNGPVPDMSDVSVFPNGAVYMKCHFVTVSLQKYKQPHLEMHAKKCDVVNTHIVNNIFNAMFKNQTDAEKFGNSI
jgi:hypothetical protein